MSTLTDQEIHRYARHLSIPQIGKTGQEKFKSAKILLIGAGGIGSPAALYLTATGVGTIGLMDGDIVEEHNLQRQVLYNKNDLGKLKLDQAIPKLQALNPNVNFKPYPYRLDENTNLSFLKEYDVIIDGTDNYPTRYLINKICHAKQIPLISASVYQLIGQLVVFNANKNSPCYSCLYPEPPPAFIPTPSQAGVLGVIPGILSTLAVNEAIKIILHQGDILQDLLVFDALKCEFKKFKITKNAKCEVCSKC